MATLRDSEPETPRPFGAAEPGSWSCFGRPESVAILLGSHGGVSDVVARGRVAEGLRAVGVRGQL